METVVDVTIPTDEFVLAETVESVPDVEFEAVRFAVDGSDRTMPFLWGTTDHPGRLDDVLRDDPTVATATRLSEDGGHGLYAVDWTARAERVVEALVEAAGTVLEVHGTGDGWTLRVLFPDRPTASETYQSWCRDGVGPSLCRINDLSGQGASGLSPTQQRAVLTAFRTDYYEVPRGTTLEELASEFEVSHQALSESLRRGHANLVEQMLATSSSPSIRAP